MKKRTVKRYEDNWIYAEGIGAVDLIHVPITAVYGSRLINCIPLMPEFGLTLPKGRGEILLLFRDEIGKVYRSGLIHESGHIIQIIMLHVRRLAWIRMQITDGKRLERAAQYRQDRYDRNQPLPEPQMRFDAQLLEDIPTR